MYLTKKRSCIIIDDDESSIEVLTDYVDASPRLELIKTYNDPVCAAKEIALSKISIDFLLLDINMPKISGLELAAMIRHKVDKLIFTTAHAKYSLQAYEVLCNQYLLKPFSQQKFTTTIDQLINNSSPEKLGTKESMFIKLGNNGKYITIKYDDIIYINALEHYVVVHTIHAQYIQHLSLKEVEYALYEHKNFIRIHKSYIISKNHILSVYGNSIILSNNFEITIGSTFKETFSRFLNSNLLT